MSGSSSPEAKLLFGRIARKHRFVLPEDLEECVAMSERLRMMGLAKRLGEILADQGYLSADHVQWILERQSLDAPLAPEDTRFGDLAVLNGFVPPGHVDRALRAQQKEARRGETLRIGEILVAEGIMRAADRDAVLALQRRVRAAPAGAPAETPAPAQAPSFLLLEATRPRKSRTVLAVLVAAALLLAAAAAAALLLRL